MPGMPASVDDEREQLLLYLIQQREGLKNAGFGLTDEQARSTPTRSALSIAGLIKHAAHTEKGWTDTMTGRPSAGEDAYADSFAYGDATLADLIAQFDRVAAETEQAVRGLHDLDQRFLLPPAPWFTEDPKGVSARWILIHVIEELARHAGHADIVREHIDGATMYELMAGAEGWPETDWLKPWRPAQSG